MTIGEAKNIFSEYHTGEVIDYDYVIELIATYCNKKEPIDEEKLDELACECACNYSDGMDNDSYIMKVAYVSFIAGYRKAKEE